MQTGHGCTSNGDGELDQGFAFSWGDAVGGNGSRGSNVTERMLKRFLQVRGLVSTHVPIEDERLNNLIAETFYQDDD